MKRLVPLGFVLAVAGRRLDHQFARGGKWSERRVGEFGLEPDGA